MKTLRAELVAATHESVGDAERPNCLVFKTNNREDCSPLLFVLYPFKYYKFHGRKYRRK
jgi:hypothetical protein